MDKLVYITPTLSENVKISWFDVAKQLRLHATSHPKTHRRKKEKHVGPGFEPSTSLSEELAESEQVKTRRMYSPVATDISITSERRSMHLML